MYTVFVCIGPIPYLLGRTLACEDLDSGLIPSQRKCTMIWCQKESHPINIILACQIAQINSAKEMQNPIHPASYASVSSLPSIHHLLIHNPADIPLWYSSLIIAHFSLLSWWSLKVNTNRVLTTQTSDVNQTITSDKDSNVFVPIHSDK